jgi:hypothetical protein
VEGETEVESGGEEDVGGGDALGDKESAESEMLINDSEGVQEVFVAAGGKLPYMTWDSDHRKDKGEWIALTGLKYGIAPRMKRIPRMAGAWISVVAKEIHWSTRACSSGVFPRSCADFVDLDATIRNRE